MAGSGPTSTAMPPVWRAACVGTGQGDAEAVREALRASLGEPLGETQAIRVLEETGLLTKGQHAAGVARP